LNKLPPVGDHQAQVCAFRQNTPFCWYLC
jgi:hypothetical protein